MANQLARRNLRDEQRSYLRGKYWKGIEAKGGRPKNHANVARFPTLHEVAVQQNVAPRTVVNDTQYSVAVDTVERNVPGARETILAGESGLPKAEVVKMAQKPRAGSVSAGRPVRLHEALAAPRAEAGVNLRHRTQWAGHTLGEQGQMVAFHAAEFACGAAYPGHSTGGSLVVVADVH